MGFIDMIPWGIFTKTPILLWGFNLKYPDNNDNNELNVKIVSITLPKELLENIDKNRGDVNRSRFLSNLIKNNIHSHMIHELIDKEVLSS